MIKFNGFDDWIEIFRGGKQTDSNGRPHDGDALIDKAVKKFNVAEHEPPLVVGHPANNSPAFGWVEKLKKTTKNGATVLLAQFKDVVPEFEELVRKGVYKKRSASFYPDGSLRHVGFLGAAPPAVKGLADLKFNEEAASCFEFYNPEIWTISRIFQGLRDWLIESAGKEKADSIIDSWDIEYLRDSSNAREPDESGLEYTETKKEDGKMKFSDFLEAFKFWKQMEKDPDSTIPDVKGADDDPAKFTEADIAAVKKRAEEETRQKVEAEFAEKAADDKRKAAQASIVAWCKEMVSQGKMAPSWVESGLQAFCERLDAVGEIEFSEEKKQTPLDWFKDFIESLPKLVNFEEVATRDRDVDTGEASDKIKKLIAEKQKTGMDYSAAFSEVQVEHPDLANEYLKEIGFA